MFTKSTIIYIALSFVLFAYLFQEADSCFLYYKLHVNIYNNLPPIEPPLSVHCKSKDDDLGNHTLTRNQTWGFSFCLKLFSTLFWCDLYCDGLSLNMVAYDAKWDYNPCKKGNCTWTIDAYGAKLPKGEMIYWNRPPP
ncbi:hypothetical protein CASFOL_012685 [Castilleja foliolosa]|uniref:S-protein homolog n=1 Tax=Castilleja foliolosa TaxID=1961234 RepID=A0ABD3DHU2_9LAMI